jgi:hypothetical protein
MKRIIKRAEAERRGLNRYFTGEPCRYGHVCERYVKREWCVECACAGNKPNIRVIRKYFTGEQRSRSRRAGRAGPLPRWFLRHIC